MSFSGLVKLFFTAKHLQRKIIQNIIETHLDFGKIIVISS